ncbi:MAG: hypothetical protein QM652_08630 [Legionella sp.]|uniref:hypothetical protein n=1 Tax=Legionella sp. TaxID=459 RepID=UPI0039E3CDB2
MRGIKYLGSYDDPKKAWLIEWRDFNCPHHRVEQILKTRVVQLKKDLELAIENVNTRARQLPLIRHGLTILDEIEKEHKLGVSGKRLLLEVASRTTGIALHPEEQTQEQLDSFSKVREKLSIDYPKLTSLAGALKTFAGAVVYFFSAGKKSHLLESGLATFRAGSAQNIESRKEMQKAMKGQLELYRSDKVEQEDDLSNRLPPVEVH